MHFSRLPDLGGRGYQVSWLIVVMTEEVFFPPQSHSFVIFFFHLPLILKCAHSLAHPLVLCPFHRAALDPLFSLLCIMCWHMCLCVRQPCLHSLPGTDALKFNSHSSFCCKCTLSAADLCKLRQSWEREIGRENHFPPHEESVPLWVFEPKLFAWDFI